MLLTLGLLSPIKSAEYKHEFLGQNDGFRSSIIFSIVQDDNGYLWFGTAYDGIMRFDGRNVVSFINDPLDPTSIPHNNSGNLLLTSNGDMWIGSWGGGAALLEYSSQNFKHFRPVVPANEIDYETDNAQTINASRIQSLFEDNKGNVWLGSYNQGLFQYNKELDNFTQPPFSKGLDKANNSVELSNERIWDIDQSDTNGLWVATNNGLNYLNFLNNTFDTYYPVKESRLIERNRIRQIKIEDENTLFLGTQNGVSKFDVKSKTFTTLKIKGRTSLGPIYSMIKTTYGDYWVSTDFGVYSFNEKQQVLTKVPLKFDDTCSQSLFQDRQGTIWLSCEGDGVYKITKSNIFSTFDPQELTAAFALHEANDNSILVGTYQNGLKKWIPETNDVVPLTQPNNKYAITDIRFVDQKTNNEIWYANRERVFSINDLGNISEFIPALKYRSYMRHIRDMKIDEDDTVWIVVDLGVYKIDPLTGEDTFYLISESQPDSSQTLILRGVFIDRNNDVWALVKNYVFLYEKESNKFKKLAYDETETEKNNEFNYIFAAKHDSLNNYWLANSLGLYKSNMITGERELVSDYFNERENRAIRYMIEDTKYNLWLVSAVDVSRLNLKTGELDHFDARDGLPDTRYYYNPTYRLFDEKIYLSSRAGIFYFDPADVQITQNVFENRLTNFEVLGLPVKFNVNDLMENSIYLDDDQTNIRFEFATLDLLNARQIRYQYKLEGFDSDWIENGTDSSATYTNLSGGKYTFKVRSRVKEKLWYENELAVEVNIATPIWQQWWMLMVYAGLIVLLVMYYLHRQKKAVIYLEKQVADKTADIALESKKLAAANRIKTQFLANMSHEIRTPLTTVIGQAEAIICREVNANDIYKEVGIIHDSSIYLLTLLNDILDLTKIEENKFHLECTPQDLHILLENINTMFSMQARVKGLSFIMEEKLVKPFVVNVDGLRLKQILVNLLSNAIKFTLQGYVKLKVEVIESRLIFHVEDTGIGISDEQLEQIFDSFTQGDASIRRRFGGSGLGLHLSNQLAVLMEGKINVQSRIGNGSTFSFCMPLPEISDQINIKPAESERQKSSSKLIFEGKVLLAEDHQDNRRLISRLLENLGFEVHTAKDGFEVVEQYERHLPDAVFLDIQMPIMDGLQAFKVLREQGCKVPIIALTANAMPNEVEEYFSLGFDGYIQKPIDREFLISTLAKYFDVKSNDPLVKADSILNNVDISDLVEEFKQGLQGEWTLFEKLIEANDLDSIEAQAHKLSGAAQLFGFENLSAIATQLERKIKNGGCTLGGIEKDLSNLKCAIEKCL